MILGIHALSGPLSLKRLKGLKLCILRSQMQNFLRQGLPPYNAQNSYTYIHLDKKTKQNKIKQNKKKQKKKGAEIFIFSTPIVAFSYARGRFPLATPKSYTLKILNYLRAWNYAFYLTKYKFFLHKQVLPWTPVKGFSPGPHPGALRRAWPPLVGFCALHSMFLPPSNS